MLTSIKINHEWQAPQLIFTATVRCEGKTGVEMEALAAVNAAALTTYDMLKALSHDMVIGPIELITKSGGRSGTITREPRS